jgi:hypothetical protein
LALNNILNSFTAFATGSFAGNPSRTGDFSPTPEPGTMALAFSAVPVLGVFVLRRRFRRI